METRHTLLKDRIVHGDGNRRLHRRVDDRARIQAQRRLRDLFEITQ